MVLQENLLFVLYPAAACGSTTKQRERPVEGQQIGRPSTGRKQIGRPVEGQGGKKHQNKQTFVLSVRLPFLPPNAVAAGRRAGLKEEGRGKGFLPPPPIQREVDSRICATANVAI